MKKLLTICLLIATAFSAKAQDMNFEETVKYINEKIECCADYKFTLIAMKNGTLKFASNSINLFDLSNHKSDYVQYGIYNILNGPSGISYVGFSLSPNNSVDLARFANQKDAERIYKALLHLRSLCTKEKDPFDK